MSRLRDLVHDVCELHSRSSGQLLQLLPSSVISCGPLPIVSGITLFFSSLPCAMTYIIWPLRSEGRELGQRKAKLFYNVRR